MNATRDILQLEFEDLICYGCSSHLANLLAEKICPIQIIGHIKTVQKFFKSHQVPSALLLEHEGAPFGLHSHVLLVGAAK